MVERTQIERVLPGLKALPEAFAELSLAMVTEPNALQEKSGEFARLLHHTGELAVSQGWLGLLDICSLLGEQLEVFAAQAEALSPETINACTHWAVLLQRYLDDPENSAVSLALVDFVSLQCWGLGIDPSTATDMQLMLSLVPVYGSEDELPSTVFEAGVDQSPTLSDIEGLADSTSGEVDALDLMAAFVGDVSLENLAHSGSDEGLFQNIVDELGGVIEKDSSETVVSEHDIGMAAEMGALDEALELMAVEVDSTSSDERLNSFITDFGLSILDSDAGDISMTDHESLLEFEETAEEEEDSLAAFADELVADELALTDTPGGDKDLSEGVSQLLSILVAELPQIEVALREWLGLLASSNVEKDIQLEACSTVQELLGRLQVASDSMGLQGLSQVCELTIINLTQIDGEEDQSHWVQVLSLLRDYLNDPQSAVTTDKLIGFLSDDRLPAPITELEAVPLAKILAQPDFSSFEDEVIDRLQEASAEHVSLDVGDDVSPELFDGLLQELPQFCEAFSLAVQRLIVDGSMDDVNDAQRIAHTIKGAGNVVGIRGVAELTHHLEDILIVLAKYETLPSGALAETLIKASDCLESMSDALQGFSSAPDNAQQVLQEVLDWANLIDSEGPPAPDVDTDVELSSGTSPMVAAPQVSPIDNELESANTFSEEPVIANVASVSPLPVGAGEARDTKSEGATLRVSAGLVDDLLRLVGEATILNAQLRERVQQTQDRAQLLEVQFDAIHQLGTELEELVDIKDFSSHRDEDDDFDALEMDQYNELHSYSRRMIEAAVDAKEMGQAIMGELDTLADMVVNQGQINSETHEGVLKTRMVPVDSVFARLQRCVRQTCRATGKQVELVLTGGETMMDSEVLRDVVDPVMHLLRNAIDHGIEAADSRESAGKSTSGRLELGFSRDGNHILVRCKDDGRGLDYDAIRVAAVRDGLIDEDADISEDELKRMVLRPNFTTRGTVTQVSGRGIGLNAVYGQVIGLKGSLQLDSISGQGCTMDIRLPVTLLSTHALLVRVDQQTYALASRGIERIVHAEDGEFTFFGGERVYRLEQRPYRVRRLANVLGLEAEAVDGVQRAGSVILMEIDDRVEAVVVDEVVGSRELVVKTLGQYMPKLTGIVGATILGDGRVSPVLDLVEMLRQPVVFEQHAANEYGRTSSGALSNKPVAMVVDDSLSARRALAQLLADAGYDVKTARDGMEAVDLLSSVRPDIMFVDMEMPRMNGIELTSHVRSRGGLEQLPVVMITSRSTEKHRRQATDAGVNLYLTKPFSGDQLIAQIEYLTGSFV